jgi:hypothetical protein
MISLCDRTVVLCSYIPDSVFSRTRRKAMRWCSVTRVTSVCIKRAMASQLYHQAPGCVVPVPSTCVLNVCCVPTRGVP